VTLRTLRALALALDVRPGALVDGQMPGAGPPLTRTAIERIAKAAVKGTSLVDPRESMLAGWLRTVISPELPSRETAGIASHRPGTREIDRSHLLLKGSLGGRTFRNICERTRELIGVQRIATE